MAGLIGLIGMNLLAGPVDARRVALEFQLENARSYGAVDQAKANVNYEDIQYSISAKPNLWTPLTKAAKAALKPPNLEQMLSGVTISRNTVGSGEDVKIKIMSPENRGGQWVGVGGNVRGLAVKSIDSRLGEVVFMTSFQGREYTYTLKR